MSYQHPPPLHGRNGKKLSLAGQNSSPVCHLEKIPYRWQDPQLAYLSAIVGGASVSVAPLGFLASPPCLRRRRLWIPALLVRSACFRGLRRLDCASRLRESLRLVKRVEEKLIRSVRLPAPLWPEPQQINAPLPVLHFERGGFALNALGMQQVPAHERVFVLRVRRQHAPVQPLLGLECWPALKHHDRVVWQSRHRRIRHVLDLHPQQAARAEKLFILQSSQHVFHRQPQLVDGKTRRIVERD